MFIHDFIHSFAQPGSYKAPLLLINISPVLNSADNGYIGTGTANTLLLKFFNQACFTKTWWWLSEMLLRCQSMQIQHFLHTKSWKPFLFLIVLPHCIKARELEMGTCCSKNVLASHDVYPNRIKDGWGHKASNKTSPDQVIKLKLFGGKMRLYHLRSQRNISRANRFVGVLSGRFSLTCPSLSNIGLTIFLCDILFYFRLRFIRNASRS